MLDQPKMFEEYCKIYIHSIYKQNKIDFFKFPTEYNPLEYISLKADLLEQEFDQEFSTETSKLVDKFLSQTEYPGKVINLI